VLRERNELAESKCAYRRSASYPQTRCETVILTAKPRAELVSRGKTSTCVTAVISAAEEAQRLFAALGDLALADLKNA